MCGLIAAVLSYDNEEQLILGRAIALYKTRHCRALHRQEDSVKIRTRMGRYLTFRRGGAHTRRREAALRQGENPQKPRSGGVLDPPHG
jgi:hypothetical protein